MTEYSVEFKSSVEKDLRSIDAIHHESIFFRIGNLSTDPTPHESKKISDSESLCRIRSGDYRIIYSIDHNKKSVTIYYVRHRKIAYRNF